MSKCLNKPKYWDISKYAVYHKWYSYDLTDSSGIYPYLCDIHQTSGRLLAETGNLFYLTDDLATQGAGATASMRFTMLNRINFGPRTLRFIGIVQIVPYNSWLVTWSIHRYLFSVRISRICYIRYISCNAKIYMVATEMYEYGNRITTPDSMELCQ